MLCQMLEPVKPLTTAPKFDFSVRLRSPLAGEASMNFRTAFAAQVFVLWENVSGGAGRPAGGGSGGGVEHGNSSAQGGLFPRVEKPEGGGRPGGEKTKGLWAHPNQPG